MERDIKPTYDELESYVENLQKQLADAQATIAALQAVIRQMGEQAAVLAKDGMAAKAQVAALQAQLATCFKLSGADPDGNEDWRLAPHAVDEVTRLRNDYDELGDETEALRGQLTQRTVELKAAKRERDHAKKMEVVQKEVADNQTWHVQQLRAELERVKQALCDADERASWCQYGR